MPKRPASAYDTLKELAESTSGWCRILVKMREVRPLPGPPALNDAPPPSILKSAEVCSSSAIADGGRSLLPTSTPPERWGP